MNDVVSGVCDEKGKRTKIKKPMRMMMTSNVTIGERGEGERKVEWVK